MKRRIELLAFALWAKEKCTTPYGISIEHWEKMAAVPKAAWLALGRKQL